MSPLPRPSGDLEAPKLSSLDRRKGLNPRRNELKKAVYRRDLASALRENGVDAILDQWDVSLGGDLAGFMEGIAAADRVVAICTDVYVKKANQGRGGVGFEKQIMTAELLDDARSSKVIPVVRNLSDEGKVPTFLKGRLYIDFTEGAEFGRQVTQLLREIYQKPDPAMRKPEIGANPFEGE